MVMHDAKLWDAPPRDPVVPENEVQVFVASSPFDEAALERVANQLSPREAARSRKFLRLADRNRFVATRVLLRSVLGRVSDRDPAALELGEGPHGKPYLVTSSRPPLGFNASHSGDLVVCAVARAEHVGVDVERRRDRVNVDALAARNFSPIELAAFGRIPAVQRTEAFFTVWTRKEAYIKAIGTGFSTSPTVFSVSVAPDEPARILAGAPGIEPHTWSMMDFSPAAGYAGAVVVDGTNWTYRFWDAAKDPTLAPWATALGSTRAT